MSGREFLTTNKATPGALYPARKEHKMIYTNSKLFKQLV